MQGDAGSCKGAMLMGAGRGQRMGWVGTEPSLQRGRVPTASLRYARTSAERQPASSCGRSSANRRRLAVNCRRLSVNRRRLLKLCQRWREAVFRVGKQKEIRHS